MKKLFLLLSVSILSFSSYSKEIEKFFPEQDLMTLGIYYYPEHWDSSQWERDIKRISELGFSFVHMGEFAWIDMEPEEGRFNFSWLDRAIQLCEKYKLKVVLCTPSITPPVWLGLNHPEIYLMNTSYIRQEHGTRDNNSITNSLYRDYCSKIITELGRRYGKRKSIIGWQIDNEPGAKADYSPSSQEAFKKWLKEKYKTIDQLNIAWGTQFWSQRYASFGQIQIPNAGLVGWWGSNPHALLDFTRYSADMQADFLDFQAGILRKLISENQFVTTNYVATGNSSDPRRTRMLDFASFTAYPNYGSKNIGDLGFRLGNSQVLNFGNDFMRSWHGTGIMELQPGEVNWADINSRLLPGTVRMWLYHCFASGSKFACSYRFRQINYSSEQFHSGIMQHDGKTLTQGGVEYQQTIAELQRLKSLYQPGKKEPLRYASRRTAILWNFDNLWSMQRQRQSAQWDTRSHIMKYSDILKSFGAPVDFIYEQDDFSVYKFIIAPAYELLDSALVTRWTKYVSEGGNLVLTLRTGVKNRNGHIWQAKWAEPIRDLINADIEYYDQLHWDGNGIVAMNNKNYIWNNWADVISAKTENEILAKFSNQFYSGKAAVVEHKIGKGSVTYIGVDTDDATLEKDVLNNLFLKNKVEIENYPPGVFVNWRDGFWIAVNYSSEKQEVKLPEGAKIIAGESALPPAGVLVWME